MTLVTKPKRASDLAKLAAKPKPSRKKDERVLDEVNGPLNDQQKLFAKHWAEGDSIASAALRAGYSDPNYGHQLKIIPKVRQAYEVVKQQYQIAAQVSKEDVINGIKDAISDAKLMSEPATQIAGWREIGKLCGFYEAKKIDLNVNVQGAVMLDRMNKMSDSELLKIINEASALGVEQAELLDHDDDGTDDQAK
jgi:hypothetical protein